MPPSKGGGAKSTTKKKPPGASTNNPRSIIAQGLSSPDGHIYGSEYDDNDDHLKKLPKSKGKDVYYSFDCVDIREFYTDQQMVPWTQVDFRQKIVIVDPLEQKVDLTKLEAKYTSAGYPPGIYGMQRWSAGENKIGLIARYCGFETVSHLYSFSDTMGMLLFPLKTGQVLQSGPGRLRIVKPGQFSLGTPRH